MAGKKKESAIDPHKWEDVPEIPKEEQPYPLPEGWKWVNAIDIFSIAYGKGLPTKKLVETGYPVFGANGRIGFYYEYMYEESQALMSCRGAYSGEMNLSDPYSFITNNSLIIKGKDFYIDPEFIFFLLSSIDKGSLVSGSAQPQVTIQAFNNFKIPFPHFKYHKLIVNKIKSLFSKLDEAAEKVQTVIDSHEARKQAILHKAFSGELTRKWRQENGVSKDRWQQTTIGDILKVHSGTGLTSKHMSKHGKIPVYGGNGITGYHNQYNTKRGTIIEGINQIMMQFLSSCHLHEIWQIRPSSSLPSRASSKPRLIFF